MKTFYTNKEAQFRIPFGYEMIQLSCDDPRVFLSPARFTDDYVLVTAWRIPRVWRLGPLQWSRKPRRLRNREVEVRWIGLPKDRP